MSKRSRYYFTKRIYPNYLVLIYANGSYYSYGDDNGILNYIGFKNSIAKIKKYKINYLILDNLDIIHKETFENNMYSKYLYLTYFDKICNEIKINIIKNIG